MLALLLVSTNLKKEKMEQEVSAGIIPLHLVKENILLSTVYLVKLKSGNHYSFPKGHLDKGESLYAAATRELHEETKLRVKELLLEETFEEKYELTREGRVVAKKVIFFVAEVTGEAKIDPNEILDGKWVLLEEAINILTYPSSKKTCLAVMESLKAKYYK